MSSFSSQRLDGRVAIVTGSSSGLGEAFALLFASKGACVTLCGRNETRLEQSRQKCQKASGGQKDRFITVQGDVNDPAIRTKIVEETVKAFGRLDILVASAGILPLPVSFLEEKEEDFDVCMDTCLKSVLFLIKESVPYLEKTKGTIALVSTSGAMHTITTNWAYSCVKAAQNQMARALAIPLGQKGIRINSTCPGFVPTKIMRCVGESMLEYVNAQSVELSAHLHPLSKRLSTIEEQADVIAFASSPESSCMSAYAFTLDGLFHSLCHGLNYFPDTGIDLTDSTLEMRDEGRKKYGDGCSNDS